jgi:hypothetical protein
VFVPIAPARAIAPAVMIATISATAMACVRVNLNFDTLKLNFTFWSILERQHGSTGSQLPTNPCVLGDRSRWTRSPT